MSLKNQEGDSFSVEPAIQASNSSNMPTNSFLYPVYNAPQQSFFPPVPAYTASNLMVPGPGQQSNILVPPFPPPPILPPFPPPFYPRHSVDLYSSGGQYQKSFQPPFQSELNISGYSDAVKVDTGNKVLENEQFLHAISCPKEENQDFCASLVSGDELWLQSWLANRCNQEEKPVKKSPVKIHEVKESLKNCLMLLQNIECLKMKMMNSYKAADELSWRNLTADFIKKQNQVAEILCNLPDRRDIQKAVEKRQKKRNSEKMRRVKWKETKKENQEKRLILHHKIDTWLQDMQKSIDQRKREESLKKEADSVLSDVLRKKSEGRRQLALVTSLLKLRQLRAKSAANKGIHISADEGIRFAKVADHLKELWEKQLEEYNVEEQGMRVMLSEAVDERDLSQVNQERRILSQWNKVLFSSEQPLFPEFYLAAEMDDENFIAIRQAWDRWIAAPDAPVKSNIPIGWVLPCNPSSKQWEKYLSM